MRRVRATVSVDAATLAGLRVQFGTNVVVSQQVSEDRYEGQIGGSSSRVIAEQLAGWGKAVAVVQPKAVRGHLAQIGAELVETYGKH